jgi:hypothetical protein
VGSDIFLFYSQVVPAIPFFLCINKYSGMFRDAFTSDDSSVGLYSILNFDFIGSVLPRLI